MITIGIDPGTNGGIAWIHEGKACAVKMPDTLQELWEVFQDIKTLAWPCINGANYHAYLEQVSSSPQMGVKSAFTFGNGFGHLEMALTASGIAFTRVRPQVWQKSLGCLTKGDKNVTKRRASELFPDIKVTHSIADALLIAKYGTTQ